MRVSRKSLLIAAIIIITIFGLEQIYLYLQVTYNGTANFALGLHVDDVRRLMHAGEDTGVVSILFEPTILSAWSNSNKESPVDVCIFLCHVIGPLTFAVSYGQLKERPQFLTRLAQLGFTVTLFDSPDNVRSHIHLLRVGSPIHIVVLHWASAGYWHQYALHGSPHTMAVVKQYITRQTWDILSVDRAYERFDTKLVNIDGIQLTIPADLTNIITEHKSAKFIPCNESRALSYYMKHPRVESPVATKFRHKAWKVLAKAKTLLDQLKVPFWLSSGTCLGFYRECDIIPWAMDVDLGVFIEDYNSRLIEEFEARGLQLTHKFGKVEDSFELSFLHDEIKLDIFFFYTDGAVTWNGGTQARSGKKFKYSFSAFTLCWTEFLELKVRIPCQTEEYIHSNYGSSWHTPIKQWDWKSSPPNVQENGVWPENEWAKVIYVKSG